jgi:hypothetical protein
MSLVGLLRCPDRSKQLKWISKWEDFFIVVEMFILKNNELDLLEYEPELF